MDRWEYTTLAASVLNRKKTQEQLNELGRQGWELVCVCDSVYFYFKRKVMER